MNTKRNIQLHQLLRRPPKGAVFFSTWMCKNGISYGLQRRYRDSHLLSPISPGVMVRAGEKPSVHSALSCFNNQFDKHFHIGAFSALKLTSCVRNVPVEQKQIVVYYPDNGWFPAWMKRYFKTEILKISSKILDERTGVISAIQNGFEILLSSPERALIEMLSLSPGCYNLKALYLIMKQLPDLNPALVQSLLEQCKSIKTKRLFLFMAEKAGHGWFDALNTFGIDLGDGKREVVVNGVYIPKYRMVVPEDLGNL